jgi:hypothetical protein
MALKRAVATALFVLSAPAVFAGVVYHFDTATTGVGGENISGNVAADGPRMRVDIVRGDGASFPDGSYVLADGNRISVCDPSTKTYYDLVFDPLAPLKSMLGDAVAMSNEHSSTRDLGAGHSITTSSYDMNVAVIDQKITMHVAVTTESWTTDKYPASASIGRVLSSDPHAPNGGFPMKQVTTYRIDENGTPIEMTSTTTVTGVATKPVAPADLAMPAGYRKVDSPIDRAMKSLGK